MINKDLIVDMNLKEYYIYEFLLKEKEAQLKEIDTSYKNSYRHIDSINNIINDPLNNYIQLLNSYVDFKKEITQIKEDINQAKVKNEEYKNEVIAKLGDYI